MKLQGSLVRVRLVRPYECQVDAGFAIYAGTEEELLYPESWQIAKEYIGKAGGSRDWDTLNAPSDPLPTVAAEAATTSVYTIDFAKIKNDDEYSLKVKTDVDTEICTAESYRPILSALGAKLSEARDERRRLAA